ncbi:putative nucleoporin-like protein 2 [Apostichopus japonicus]|uniref:Nucleoporin NUP42 n=1 Tax=Stichopus japonicus TaxID=307972 RepID=A0A2G8K5R1_STIJA|nr:putative nucleoporin-like protein 2 [Apostichopus japonicus]
MVVCRFFLKGTCKFGDRCRNEHPRNTSEYNAYPSQPNWQQGGNQYHPRSQDTFQGRGSGHQSYYNQGNSSGTAFGNQNRFAALSDDYQANNKGKGSGPGGFGDGGNDEPRPGEILESIKRDAEEWDVSKMWPYSCYRPSRAQGDVPGLQDLSPEELRLEAYIAAKENRFETYKSAVSVSADALKRKLEMMKKPSGELKNALISLYRGQQKTGSFGGQSIFGMQDIFNFEIFTKAGLFSNPSSASSSSGVFGSTTLGTGFGTQPVTPSSPPHGLFGNPSGATSSFGSTAPSSGFGNSGGLFGKPDSQNTGLFGQPAQTGTGLFGKPGPPAGAPFGQPSSQSVGLFGKPAPSGGGGQSSNEKWYTPISELTAEEKEQFEAPSFTLGKIPTRPPPLELVNTAA